MIEKIWLELLVLLARLTEWWYDEQWRGVSEYHRRDRARRDAERKNKQAKAHEAHTDGGVPSCHLCYEERRA